MKILTEQKILYIVESLVRRLREKRKKFAYESDTDVCKITVGASHIMIYFTEYGLCFDAYDKTYPEGWNGHYAISTELETDPDFWEWRSEIVLTGCVISLMRLNHVHSINKVDIDMLM